MAGLSPPHRFSYPTPTPPPLGVACARPPLTMVKYVDAGADTAGSGNKKMRKGFKADRLENYKRTLAKKNGKKVKEAPARTVRPKALTFDDASRRDYLMTLHNKKNERRVQAFVDAKRKQRKDSAKTRREQREEARRAYNNYARVPILPDYTYRLPKVQDEGFADGEDEEAGEDDEVDGGSEDGQQHLGGGSSESDAAGEADEGDAEMPWMSVDDPEAAARDANAQYEADVAQQRHRRRAKRLATQAHSAHAMPSAMLGHGGDATQAAPSSAASSAHRAAADVDKECVTVEVKPLFGSGATPGGEAAARRGGAAARPLPSNNFDDLPLVVQQELRRLRQETKGPTKTKPRMHMMKELEKIRKIRKHSRKGHGKRKASGKRKNRKK